MVVPSVSNFGFLPNVSKAARRLVVLVEFWIAARNCLTNENRSLKAAFTLGGAPLIAARAFWTWLKSVL